MWTPGGVAVAVSICGVRGHSQSSLASMMGEAVDMPGKSHRGPLPPLSDVQIRVRDGLQKDLGWLAGEIGERDALHPVAYAEAAGFVERRLVVFANEEPPHLQTSAIDSLTLVKMVVGSFRRHAAFPSEGGAVPDRVEGAGLSDHWAFWQCGYPAVMVADTAPFRYPHYHRATDTPDKIDYDRLARVVLGLRNVIEELCARGRR